MALLTDRNFYRYADTVGDGTGTINFNGDYSGSPTEARLDAAALTVLRVSRLIVTIQDATGFRAENYGRLGAPLANGVQVQHLANDGAVIENLTDGEPIRTNAGWGSLCYDVTLKEWGAGDDFLLARWTFTRASLPIKLRPGERLAVVLNDDLRGLVQHRFQFQGRARVYDDAGNIEPEPAN